MGFQVNQCLIQSDLSGTVPCIVDSHSAYCVLFENNQQYFIKKIFTVTYTTVYDFILFYRTLINLAQWLVCWLVRMPLTLNLKSNYAPLPGAKVNRVTYILPI